MREQVEIGKPGLQPARHDVDRQRKAVHLDKKRDDEGSKRAEGSPVAGGLRLEEAECEHQENGRIKDNEYP